MLIYIVLLFRIKKKADVMANNVTGNRIRILLGGGAGYIGSALVPVLLEHGYDVTVIDLSWFGIHLPNEAKVIEKDLFDVRREEMEGFDAFIFLQAFRMTLWRNIVLRRISFTMQRYQHISPSSQSKRV